MILYVGVAGVPQSLMPFEFENFRQAEAFAKLLKKRYMEEGDKLYVAYEPKLFFEELDLVYKDKICAGGEISLEFVETEGSK